MIGVPYLWLLLFFLLPFLIVLKISVSEMDIASVKDVVTVQNGSLSLNLRFGNYLTLLQDDLYLLTYTLAQDDRLTRRATIWRRRRNRCHGWYVLETVETCHFFNQVFLDFDVEPEGPWIAYEYLPGRSLRDMLRGGALPQAQALDIACQIARRCIVVEKELDLRHPRIDPRREGSAWIRRQHLVRKREQPPEIRLLH